MRDELREAGLTEQMRTAVAAEASTGKDWRAMSAPALVGLLSASALTPVIAVVGGNGPMLAAGAGALGSIGANVLTGVVTDAISRLRGSDTGTPPTAGEVRTAVSDRIEAAFRSGGPEDRALRDEVAALFQSVDILGAAMQAAAVATDQETATAIASACVELTALFGEFAFALTRSRLTLEHLHQDVRRELARQECDRERAKRAEADIGRILESLQNRPSTPYQTGQTGHIDRTRAQECPFRGLLAFEERHATMFYGRKSTTSKLLHRLADHLEHPGIMLVLGPSGVGKSSLLRAGLLAAFTDDRPIRGCRSWPRRLITPTSDPIRQLATQLADLAGVDPIAVYASLSRRPDQAHLLAEQTLLAAQSRSDDSCAHRPDRHQPRLLLIVDQLEELFTIVENRNDRASFLTALDSMVSVPSAASGQPPAVVVAGMRGDLIDDAMAFAPLRQAVEAGPFTLGPMSESELAECITGPASEVGVQVPEQLVRAILDDLRQRSLPDGFDSGALPLLSQVMFVMWMAGDVEALNVAAYRRAGGVADILRASAERVYGELDIHQQDLARRVFLHLTIATDGRLTRRPASRAALCAQADGDDRMLGTVLEAFTAQRLLICTDRNLVIVSHESLLHAWTRLREWLRPNLADQALHRTLLEDARAWHAHRRDPSYLYRGDQLHAVRAAVDRWQSDSAYQLPLDSVTADFLSAGHRSHHRRRRINRAIAMTLAALLGVATAAAGVATTNATRAAQQHAVALSRQLAVQSRAASGTRWATAQRLAAAALRTAPTTEANEAASTLLADYRNIIGHTDTVAAVAFSPDGHLLATGSHDMTVRLWDPMTGKAVGKPLVGHTDWVSTVAFSPDGRLLASAGKDNLIRIWNPANGKPVGLPLVGHTSWVRALAFSPDGKVLASTGDDQQIRFWDPTTGKPAGKVLTGHTGSIRGIAFSADGRRLASASFDNTVRLWDLPAGQPIGTPMLSQTGWVNGIAFSADGKMLISANNDATLRRWNVPAGTPVGTAMVGHAKGINAVALSADGSLLASASDDKTVRLWNPATGKPTGTPLIGHTGPVTAVTFSLDGHMIATASSDATVRLWQTGTSKPARAAIVGHFGAVNAAALSPDGDLIASAGDDRTVRLWQTTTGQPVGDPLLGHTGVVDTIAFSPGGRLIASAGENATIRLWDPTTGKQTTQVTANNSNVGGVDFSPDGRLLASASKDSRIVVFDPSTGRQVGAPLLGHTGAVNAVAFSPDGNLIASGGDDKTVRLWNPTTGKSLGAPMSGHTGAVVSVSVSPDGHLVASAGRDGTVRLWDPSTGRPAGAPLLGHTGAVNAVAFSPDGKLIASGGDDKTIRLWNPTTGKPIGAPMTGHEDSVRAVGFSRTSDLLVSASSDSTVMLWDATVYADPLQSLCSQAGDITRAEWSTFAGHEPYAKVCR